MPQKKYIREDCIPRSVYKHIFAGKTFFCGIMNTMIFLLSNRLRRDAYIDAETI